MDVITLEMLLYFLGGWISGAYSLYLWLNGKEPELPGLVEGHDPGELRADVEEACGMLMVDIPEPGTKMAQVMVANAIMRRERDGSRYESNRLHRELNSLRDTISTFNGDEKNAFNLSRMQDKIIEELRNQVDALQQPSGIYRKALEHCSQDVWQGCDIDGGSFQDKMIELGLFVLGEPDQDYKDEWGDDAEMYVWAWSPRSIAPTWDNSEERAVEINDADQAAWNQAKSQEGA